MAFPFTSTKNGNLRYEHGLITTCHDSGLFRLQQVAGAVLPFSCTPVTHSLIMITDYFRTLTPTMQHRIIHLASPLFKCCFPDVPCYCAIVLLPRFASSIVTTFLGFHCIPIVRLYLSPIVPLDLYDKLIPFIISLPYASAFCYRRYFVYFTQCSYLYFISLTPIFL